MSKDNKRSFLYTSTKLQSPHNNRGNAHWLYRCVFSYAEIWQHNDQTGHQATGAHTKGPA